MGSILEGVDVEVGKHHPFPAHPHQFAKMLDSLCRFADMMRQAHRQDEIKRTIAKGQLQRGCAHVTGRELSHRNLAMITSGGGKKGEAPIAFDHTRAKVAHDMVKPAITAGQVEGKAVKIIELSQTQQATQQALFMPVVDPLGPAALELVRVVGGPF